MVKCPKCGSDDYDVLFIEDWEYNSNGAIAHVKAKCENCEKEFWVKELFKFKDAIND